MFSVIVPLYNKEKYIENCINSIINQSFDKFEIIIVDDGSTDKSVDIVRKIDDDRIKIISQKNKGVSTARNVGIKNSVNDYIAFLDADDQWNIDFLQTIVDLMEKYPEATVFYTAHKRTREKKDIFYENINTVDILIDDYFQFAIEVQAISTSSTVVVKEKLIENGLFETRFTRGEDLYLWIKLALKEKMAYSSYIGTFYNTNISKSLTKTQVSIEKSFASIAEVFYEENKEHVTYKDSFKYFMFNIIISKGRYLVLSGDKKAARKILNKYCTKYNKRKVRVMKIITYLPSPFIRRIFT